MDTRSYWSATLAGLLFAGCTATPHPDLILYNGTIYIDDSHTTDTLAIHEGRIVALGPEVVAGDTTQRVDLNGAVAYPGFHDAHVHLLPGSFVLERLVLLGASSMRTIEVKLEGYAKNNPEEPWLVGYGWVSDLMENPSGVALDTIVSDRPVLLVSNSAHQALVNSKALELAGITKDTPDPPGGHIVRDETTGQPTGLLIESALSLVSELAVSEYSDQAFQIGLENQLSTFASGGISSISEILAAPGFDLARPWIYQTLEEEGRLTTRVHYYAPVFSVEDLNDIAEFKGLYDSELIHFQGGKVWVDGSMSSGTPWVSEPHIDDSENFGLHYFEQTTLTQMIREAEALGMGLKFHVNGDAAVHATLNALETVDTEVGGLAQKYVLDHVVLINAADRARMATLGIVASVQPIHALTAKYGTSAEVWGEERYARAYDSASLIDTGLPVALGTDWPVWPSPDAIPSIWAAATVQGDASMSVRDALVAYTQGGAQSVANAEHGTLSMGARADIVVYGQDLLNTPLDELQQVELTHLFVNGTQIR